MEWKFECYAICGSIFIIIFETKARQMPRIMCTWVAHGVGCWFSGFAIVFHAICMCFRGEKQPWKFEYRKKTILLVGAQRWFHRYKSNESCKKTKNYAEDFHTNDAIETRKSCVLTHRIFAILHRCSQEAGRGVMPNVRYIFRHHKKPCKRYQMSPFASNYSMKRPEWPTIKSLNPNWF